MRNELKIVNYRLQQLFNEIELQRKLLLDSIGHLGEAQLHRTHTAGSWSIAQILSHLITAERMSVAYMQKKFQGVADVPDSGIREEIKMILLILSQRLPGVKFKAPTRVLESTTTYQNAQVITNEWDQVRADLNLLLEKFSDNQTKKMVYRHVRVGYLNVQHAILFFREHIFHHTPQVRRLL